MAWPKTGRWHKVPRTTYRWHGQQRGSGHLLMCRVLDVSRSGYHAFASRAPSKLSQENARLIVAIQAAHARGRETYEHFSVWRPPLTTKLTYHLEHFQFIWLWI